MPARRLPVVGANAAPPDARYVAYMAERSTTMWENWLGALRAAGRLVVVENVSLDGESLFRRRFRCDTRTCAPGRNPTTGERWRESGMKSCCADLTVDVAPTEIRALEARWEPIRAWLAARDRFFEGKAVRDCLELSTDFEVSLRKRGGRCIFAVRDPEWGIRCGIHAAAMASGIPVRDVKPIVCDTFPLIVIDLSPGRFYMGAHDEAIDGLASLGDGGPESFPCLRNARKGKPMYLAMEETIRAYFGGAFFEKLAAAAAAYLARPRPPKMEVP
jgi:Fe-S-cluster containining protein